MRKEKPNTPHSSLDSTLLQEIIAVQSALAEADFNLDSFLNLVANKVQELTHATGVVVELADGTDMVYRAATGSVAAHIGLRLPQKGSLTGLCVQTHQILYCKDSETDPRVNLEACRKVGARSLVVTPLFHGGKAVGVLKILSNIADAFDDKAVQILQLMAGLIGTALGHQVYYQSSEKILSEKEKSLVTLEKAKEDLQHQAEYDFLTQLPNRRFFEAKLNVVMQESFNSKKLMAVMYLDIDHFKTINDTKGHAIGDLLLKAFCKRIQHSIRETDIVARLGGDEFAIILPNLIEKKNAIFVAEKIIKNMQPVFNLDNQHIQISTSVGITFYPTEKPLELKQLVENADHALYQAKENGRNQYKINE